VSSFQEAIVKALDRNPDAVVLAGDLLHHSKPDPVSLRTVMRSLISLAEKIPVVLSIGNHEIDGHLGTTYTPLYSDIHENIHVLSSENPHVSIGGSRKTYFHGFEFIRGRDRAEDTLMKISDDVDSDNSNILVLHQALEHYLSPHEISLATLRQVAPKYDLILLGHVHKHQIVDELSDITPTFYIGSTERISFNEASNPTGFLFFDKDYGKPDYIKVKSAKMSYIRENIGKAGPDKINKCVKKLIEENKHSKLLKIDLEADISGDITEVRRDWTSYEKDHTILDVNISQPELGAEIKIERMMLDADMIREYFNKVNIDDKELEDLCVELFNKYGGE